jgi:hypothetical protein
MKKFDLYPWHKMIDDLATSHLGFPYDLREAMTRLGLSGPKQTPDQNRRDKLLAILEENLQTDVATYLYKDILTGAVQTFDQAGKPLSPNMGQLLPMGDDAPRISEAIGNAWLERRGYAWVWHPIAAPVRDQVNRQRYREASNLGFRYPDDNNGPLKNLGPIAQALGIAKSTLRASLIEYREDHPDEC